MENLSFEISKYPRDLLQRFLGGTSSSSIKFSSLDDSNIVGNDVDDDENEGGLTLGLGLSLGGRFGVDKSSKGLIRSSSLACTMPLFRDDETTIAIQPTRGVSASLVRTSSLPVESEEESRKRKEMQTLRRMEAKRRRFEKQRVLKEGGGGGCVGGGEEKCVEDLKFRGRLEKEQQSLRISSKLRTLFGSSTPPPTPTPTSNNVEVKARRTTFGSLQGFLIAQARARARAQAQARDQHGSGESQEVTSSGAYEPESKTNQASSICGEAKTPTSTHSLQEPATQEALVSPRAKSDTSQRIAGGEPELETSSKQTEVSDPNTRQETGSSSGMDDLPCVFTIGDCPNGRKVEGILYRYGKGEGVRIMCVCHGTFLSPKDFVKHAGGRIDVEHPLRHIVVSPSSSAFQ